MLLTKLYGFLYYDVFSRITPNYFHLLRKELKECDSILDMGGIKFIGKKHVSKDTSTLGRRLSWLFWFMLADISQIFVYKNPSKAFHLFCVKKL